MKFTTKDVAQGINILANDHYVAIPYDSDKAWWGYTDDFFVFMSGYAFFMATRTKSLKSRYLLYTISGSFFIIGMLALIALLILA